MGDNVSEPLDCARARRILSEAREYWAVLGGAAAWPIAARAAAGDAGDWIPNRFTALLKRCPLPAPRIVHRYTTTSEALP